MGLVASSTGTPPDPSNLRRAFSAMTTKAGLGHWYPHELRHSAGSILSAAGVRIKIVSDIMGHVDIRTTGQVYRHPVTPIVDAAVAPTEELFGESEDVG